MNQIKWKSCMKENPITNVLAECYLQIRTVMRYVVKGSYSQYKEDVWVRKYFYGGGVKTREIKYVDIGANHYKRNNNTYLFYKNGASGIIVEADPKLCTGLLKKRKRDIVCNSCIGLEEGKTVDFYRLSLPTRNTMNKDMADRAVEAGVKIKEVIKIACIKVNDLLEQYAFVPDYMSIDIEGMDYAVLRTIDFNKFPIKVIVAEYSDELICGENMSQYMKKCGYQIYKETKGNVIYCLPQ